MRRGFAHGRVHLAAGVVALAALLPAAACTRYSNDLCEVVESYETGAPRNAYVVCAGHGEELPCEGELWGQAASKGAIEAAFATCIAPDAAHPTSAVA